MTQFFRTNLRYVERISPSIIRAEFGGEDLAQFKTTGQPDEWVRLVFPDSSGAIMMPSARERLATGSSSGAGTRPYTVRSINAERATITIDFVVHSSGLATDWIRSAGIGDEIGIIPPDARYKVGADAEWILLLSDVTGLPAVSRILEQDISGLPVYVHAEIPHRQDIQAIARAEADVTWHVGFGGDAAPSRLAGIARAFILPQTPGYIWIAGEAQEIYDARAHFRDARGIPADHITAIGYWFRGKTRS